VGGKKLIRKQPRMEILLQNIGLHGTRNVKSKTPWVLKRKYSQCVIFVLRGKGGKDLEVWGEFIITKI